MKVWNFFTVPSFVMHTRSTEVLESLCIMYVVQNPDGWLAWKYIFIQYTYNVLYVFGSVRLILLFSRRCPSMPRKIINTIYINMHLPHGRNIENKIQTLILVNCSCNRLSQLLNKMWVCRLYLYININWVWRKVVSSFQYKPFTLQYFQCK